MKRNLIFRPIVGEIFLSTSTFLFYFLKQGLRKKWTRDLFIIYQFSIFKSKEKFVIFFSSFFFFLREKKSINSSRIFHG